MSNEDVEIRIFGSRGAHESADARDGQKVAGLIRSRVLPESEGEYHRVDVKVRRTRDGSPGYLVAYLLRKDIYLAEVVRLDVANDYEVTQVTWSYDDSGEDEDDEERSIPGQPENGVYGVDFVVATPVPGIASAKKLVDDLYTLFTHGNYSCTRFLGSDATIANYKLYMASGVRGFISVGHGNSNGISLYDGTLSYSWFNSLGNKQLRPAVVLFNSCLGFNSPLNTAVMNAGARTYVSGVTNLAIGPSEAVSYCFWHTSFMTSTSMGTALQNCSQQQPDAGTFGIGGDTGPFRSGVTQAQAATGMSLSGTE